MITACRLEKFSVLHTDARYIELFDLVRSDALSGTVLQHSHSKYQERLTMKVSWNGTPYIVKQIRQKKHRLEALLTLRLRGSYAQHLIRQIDKAHTDGVVFTPAIYLVAEEGDSFRAGYTLWFIIEYIEGETLQQISCPEAGYRETLKDLLRQAHRYQLVSHDPHPGNFMLLPVGQMRLIDLGGKSYTRFRAALDQIKFERRIGGYFPPHDWYYWFGRLVYGFRKRTWRHKIKQ